LKQLIQISILSLHVSLSCLVQKLHVDLVPTADQVAHGTLRGIGLYIIAAMSSAIEMVDAKFY
jgi:hypothetical protein